MTSKTLRVADYLGHILLAVERIRRYTDKKSYTDFVQDDQLQDAVVRNIEIIGEAARNIERVAPNFIVQHPQVPWSALYAMRNRVTHGYWSVDLEIVWMVLQRDLPELESQIRILANTTLLLAYMSLILLYFNLARRFKYIAWLFYGHNAVIRKRQCAKRIARKTLVSYRRILPLFSSRDIEQSRVVRSLHSGSFQNRSWKTQYGTHQ